MVYLDFVKLHGLFNSFILISDFSQYFSPVHSSSLAKKLCSSQRGIGADGLVILRPGKQEADFIMDFYNADGSQAEMCGNAIRCLAKYVDDTNLLSHKTKKKKSCEVSQIKFLTPAGIITTQLLENREWDAMVSVDMGKPVFDPFKEFPLLDSTGAFEYCNHRFVFVSLGNPHVVAFLPSDYDWNFNYQELGIRLQSENFFPKGVNVEFAKVIDEEAIEVRVIERGVGETMACGTGACAVAAAHIRNLKKKDKEQTVRILLLGGELMIRWAGGENSIEMVGPTKKVAAGRYYLEEI